ncbi:MAG: PDZ domain-containing protein [Deltaproteobacteria bacterium]|nr:PDZ domain-containing protein [Deltaproteobacteria bacterium]
MSQIEERAVSPSSLPIPADTGRTTFTSTVELREYLQSFDEYADYQSAEELKQVIAIKTYLPYGVGMDLNPQDDGTFLCWPYPGQAAAEAGIRQGDILTGVDSFNITGVEPDKAALLIAGENNSPVALTVWRDGERLEIISPRQRTEIPGVSVSTSNGMPVVRIWRFNQQTAEDLRRNIDAGPLSSSEQYGFLILDLRGNTGGDLAFMREVAKLFLAKGTVIYSARSKNKATVYRTESDGPYKNVNLVIWQDNMTASSSEVLISALKQGKQTVTMGQVSRGKACSQAVTRLKKGGMLRITTEMLFTSLGDSWEKTGLVPDKAAESESEFLQGSKLIFSSKGDRNQAENISF